MVNAVINTGCGDLGNRTLALRFEEDEDGKPIGIYLITPHYGTEDNTRLSKIGKNLSNKLRSGGSLKEIIGELKTNHGKRMEVKEGPDEIQYCDSLEDYAYKFMSMHYLGDLNCADNLDALKGPDGEIDYSRIRGYKSGFLKTPS